jgi:hypothetical protein
MTSRMFFRNTVANSGVRIRVNIAAIKALGKTFMTRFMGEMGRSESKDLLQTTGANLSTLR